MAGSSVSEGRNPPIGRNYSARLEETKFYFFYFFLNKTSFQSNFYVFGGEIFRFVKVISLLEETIDSSNDVIWTF